MGLISQALGYGTPAQSQANSLSWGANATAINAGGAFLSGLGQFQQSNYQAQVASNNARIMQANAGATRAAGLYAEATEDLKTGQLISQQKAAQGASGVDVAGGSASAVRSSAATIGAMDAAMIHYNAQRAAFGQEQEANYLTAQSQLDKQAGTGELVGGLFKGASTILGGAASVGAKYAGWQQYTNG